MKIQNILQVWIVVSGMQATDGIIICNTTDSSDAEISQCINDIAQELQSTWAAGIPALGLPAMDPLKVGGVDIEAGSGLVSFVASLSGVTLNGLNNLTGTNYVINSTGAYVDYTFTFPFGRVEGNYSATGELIQILPLPLLPISGSGSFWFEFQSLNLTGTMWLQNTTEGNVTFLQIYNTTTDISIVDYSFNFQNFGGSLLGPTINSLLNLGRTVIFNQLKPEMDATLAPVFGIVLNPFLQTQAYLAATLK